MRRITRGHPPKGTAPHRPRCHSRFSFNIENEINNYRNQLTKTLGYSTCTYVGVILERGSMYKRVVEELNHIPEVVECHFTTGPYTMLIKLYACDNAHLMELLNNKLQEIPGVISTETLISLEQSINKEIPIVLNKK